MLWDSTVPQFYLAANFTFNKNPQFFCSTISVTYREGAVATVDFDVALPGIKVFLFTTRLLPSKSGRKPTVLGKGSPQLLVHISYIIIVHVHIICSR